MFIVGRHVNGICLNELEFVLDDVDGEMMEFSSPEEAKSFLLERGAKEEDFETYLQVLDKEECFS